MYCCILICVEARAVKVLWHVSDMLLNFVVLHRCLSTIRFVNRSELCTLENRSDTAAPFELAKATLPSSLSELSAPRRMDQNPQYPSVDQSGEFPYFLRLDLPSGSLAELTAPLRIGNSAAPNWPEHVLPLAFRALSYTIWINLPFKSIEALHTFIDEKSRNMCTQLFVYSEKCRPVLQPVKCTNDEISKIKLSEWASESFIFELQGDFSPIRDCRKDFSPLCTCTTLSWKLRYCRLALTQRDRMKIGAWTFSIKWDKSATYRFPNGFLLIHAHIATNQRKNYCTRPQIAAEQTCLDLGVIHGVSCPNHTQFPTWAPWNQCLQFAVLSIARRIRLFARPESRISQALSTRLMPPTNGQTSITDAPNNGPLFHGLIPSSRLGMKIFDEFLYVTDFSYNGVFWTLPWSSLYESLAVTCSCISSNPISRLPVSWNCIFKHTVTETDVQPNIGRANSTLEYRNWGCGRKLVDVIKTSQVVLP